MKITIILMLAVMLTGCSYVKSFGDRVVGSGVIKNEKRSVNAFTSIDASGAFDVEVVCQKEQSLELEGDDNLLPLVKTEVRGSTLYIKPDKEFSVRKAIRVKIAVPNLESISSSGASSFRVADVKNEKLKIDTSGASSLNLAGETKSLSLDMSGASKVESEGLRAERVTISLSGAGKASVYASEELNAEVSGAGSVSYAGDPKTVNKHVSGVGSVSKKSS
ncbi:MAG TPA: head GIN domain-containing protein [Pyrinomonadaceae bacterium]